MEPQAEPAELPTTEAAVEPAPAPEPVAPPDLVPDPVPDIPPIDPPRPPKATITPEALAFYDAQTVQLITESMKEVDEAQKEFESLNSEMKEAKVKWQGLVQKQHALIRERRDGRGKPVQKTLFDDVIRPDDAPATGTLPAPAAASVPDVLENLWRDFPLDRFSLWGATEADLKKLADGTRKRDEPRPLATMGQLADFTANVHNPGYENRLTDFKGIGGAAADRINNAIEQFWGYWNNGGRDEYATERGLTRATEQGNGEAGVDAGGDSAAGEPGPLGDAIGAVLDRVAPEPAGAADAGAATDDAPFVEPQGSEEEYSLAGVETGDAEE